MLAAGPLGFPLQVGLDPLEEVFGDLESHGSSIVICHGDISSVLLHLQP